MAPDGAGFQVALDLSRNKYGSRYTHITPPMIDVVISHSSLSYSVVYGQTTGISEWEAP